MDKPYQRDIELLRKELECYKYVADNCKKSTVNSSRDI